MDAKTKINLDFLPLCGKGVFIWNSRYFDFACCSKQEQKQWIS